MMWSTFHDVYDCIEWLFGFLFLYCLIVSAGGLHVEGFVRTRWNMGGCILFLWAY